MTPPTLPLPVGRSRPWNPGQPTGLRVTRGVTRESPARTRGRQPHALIMSPFPPNPSGPTAGEMYDELMVMVTGIVAGAAIMPGFFLCVPGLILVVAPLVVIGLVVAIGGAVIALVVAPL